MTTTSSDDVTDYDADHYTDSVSSEVHIFTKEEVLDAKRGGENKFCIVNISSAPA